MGNLSFINIDEVEKEAEKKEWRWMDDGEYKAIIIGCNLKDNSKGTGKLVEVEFKIDGGEFDGRKIKDWFNVQHKNPEAEKIGLGQFSSMCKACGFPTIVDDSSDLMLKSLVLVIEFTDDRGDGKAGNVIKGYKSTKTPPVKKQKEQYISFEDDDIPFG